MKALRTVLTAVSFSCASGMERIWGSAAHSMSLHMAEEQASESGALRTVPRCLNRAASRPCDEPSACRSCKRQATFTRPPSGMPRMTPVHDNLVRVSMAEEQVLQSRSASSVPNAKM